MGVERQGGGDTALLDLSNQRAERLQADWGAAIGCDPLSRVHSRI